MGDYQRFYNDRWADSDIAYANVLTTGWNNWTGNSRFISNVSKTGWTGVMVRDKPDIDNNSALITWKSGATSGFHFEDTGDGIAPFIEITYTSSGGKPAASFTTNVTSGTAPLAVKFTDTSTGTAPLTYAWDFDNNGVTDSTLQNPTYTYISCRNLYGKPDGIQHCRQQPVTHVITVAAPVSPTALFTTNVTSGTAPFAVKFTDASTGTLPLTYAWDFDNNGVTDSTLQNPTYTYSDRRNVYGKPDGIQHCRQQLGYSRHYGCCTGCTDCTIHHQCHIRYCPLAVKFTDASTGTLPLTYAWDFDNNGVTDSTLQNPIYTYTAAGTYTANLTVSNTAGSNPVTHVITVAAPVSPTALFTTNVTSGTAPLAVKFTDVSTGALPLTYAWDFDNNGVTDSTLQNPTYTYSVPERIRQP